MPAAIARHACDRRPDPRLRCRLLRLRNSGAKPPFHALRRFARSIRRQRSQIFQKLPIVFHTAPSRPRVFSPSAAPEPDANATARFQSHIPARSPPRHNRARANRTAPPLRDTLAAAPAPPSAAFQPARSAPSRQVHPVRGRQLTRIFVIRIVQHRYIRSLALQGSQHKFRAIPYRNADTDPRSLS